MSKHADIWQTADHPLSKVAAQLHRAIDSSRHVVLPYATREREVNELRRLRTEVWVMRAVVLFLFVGLALIAGGR